MTKTILRFTVANWPQHNTITTYINARFLHAEYRNGGIDVWAEVCMSRGIHTYDINVFATGQDISETSGSYISTVVDNNDEVWHVYIKEGC